MLRNDDENISQPNTRYPCRNRHKPGFYVPDTSLFVRDGPDPYSIENALKSDEEGPQWKNAISEELESLKKHSTWDVVKLPEGAKPLQTRFALALKKPLDGSIKRYKARLLVRGYLQGYVDQTYAPVVDFNIISGSP